MHCNLYLKFHNFFTTLCLLSFSIISFLKDTISNNTAKLAGFLGSCFNHLASQISSENNKIQIIIEKYNIKLSNLNSKPDYVHFLLTTQQTISLALIAKINTPSTKLMQDTNYMYNLAMQYEDK